MSTEASLDKALLAALDTLSHQVAPLFERARAAGLVKGHVARLHAKLTASEGALQRAIADRDQANALARQYLLDESEALAESERARGALRDAVEHLRCTSGTLAERYYFGAGALAADQTATARESAENTAEETKMPAIVSANCPAHGLGECPAGCEGRLGKPPLAEPAQPPEPVEPTPGTVLGTARVVFRGKVEPREVEAPESVDDNEPPSPLPKVLPAGQRWFSDDGRVGVFTEPARWLGGWYTGRYECAWRPHSNAQGKIDKESIDWSHYRAQRRAAATPAAEERPWNYEAPPDSEFGKEHELHPAEHQQGHRLKYQGKDEDGEPMWGTDEIRGARIMGRSMSVKAWRRAVLDPTPKAPGGFLDAITARVEQLEGQVRGMAEGTASEFRRVDATLRAHSERIEAVVDSLKDTERDLDRRVDAQSKRLDELELHVRVHRRLLQLVFDRVGALPTFTEYWARIVGEERERSVK